MAKDKSLRATFEDTLKSQRKLRRKLQKYIENDEVLARDEEQQREFQDLVARSCLGLEREADVVIRHPVLVPHVRDGNPPARTTGIFYSGKLSGLITEVVYNAAWPEFEFSTAVENYPKRGIGVMDIGKLWSAILRTLENNIWPEARNLSLKVSPEKVPREDTYVREDW